MYFNDSQEPDSELADEVESDEEGGEVAEDSSPPPRSCSRGHRPSLNLRTRQGGGICLLCLSNLLAAAPPAPTVHVSYALSQLSRALSDPPFLRSLLAFHARLLVSPLVRALSASDDEPIARQIIDLVVLLSGAGAEWGLAGEFAARVSELLCSRALGC